MRSDPLIVLRLIVGVFEDLQIQYFVGGSIASSLHGDFRATKDVDLVAKVEKSHVPRIVASLQDEFYIDDTSIFEAIETQSSFNVIHLATMYKADIFVLKTTVWANEELARRTYQTLSYEDDSLSIYVASSEDTILQKLTWYRLGGEVSERQWLDVMGVLKVQATRLDYDYLRTWAKEQGLSDLLAKVYYESGVTDSAY